MNVTKQIEKTETETGLAPAAVFTDEIAALQDDMLTDVTAATMKIPVLYVMQSLSDRDKFGDHPDGTIVDLVTKLAVEQPVTIVPVMGIATRKVWRQGELGKPLGTFKAGEPITPDLLRDPNNRVDDHFDWYVLCPELGQMPYCIWHKSSSLNAASTLNTMEAQRRAARKVPGIYSMTTATERNAKGKWAALRYQPAGELTSDLVTTWTQAVKAISVNRDKLAGGGYTDTAAEVAAPEATDIPI